jgi:hypothetical protein
MQRAKLLSTEAMAVLVYVRKHVIQAPATDNVARSPARNPLGGPAPKDNSPVRVAHIHAVAEGIEDHV